MPYIPLNEEQIEECLLLENSEEEDISEIEDNEDYSEHETNSEQEGEDIRASSAMSTSSDEGIVPPPHINIQYRQYLDDVPLLYIKRGRFTGKDKTTHWQVFEPPQNVRTRSHNIIVHLPGPIHEGKNCATITEAFSLFFTDSMLQKIVVYTNIYIENLRSKYVRERDCKTTDITEMKALLGLLYYCGRLRSGHLNTKDLWSLDGTGSDICIAAMSRKRFHFLLKCLRFDDIRTRDERRQGDKLAAFREIFEEFNANIKKYFSLGEHVTVDEKLEKTRGRCSFRQYLPSKPGKYGIKMLLLCDARLFYTANIEIYVGKNEGIYDHSNSAADVVKRLVEPIKNSNRNVVMDNWFTSFPLMDELLKEYRLTVLGTVRKNKPQVPPFFTSTKDREINSSVFAFQPDCTLVSYVPRKGKVVLLASTMHHDAKIDESTGNKKKPEMITDYNRHKCGVDVVDELCGTYSVSRITRRWPMVLFYGLMNIGCINAYVIVKSNKENRGDIVPPRRDFLKELAVSLVMPHIRTRSTIPNLSTAIKGKIMFLLGGDNQENENLSRTHQERALQPRTQLSSSRCAVCPWKKDRKTKTDCNVCHKKICREHTVPICEECAQKV